MKLSCTYRFRPKKPTCNTSYVQTAFGIGFETGLNVIAEGVELDYEPGQIVLFSGPSGSGKSSLLRAAASQAPGAVWLDESPPPAGGPDAHDDRALVDRLGEDVRQTVHLLSRVGLAEAFLMLRTPAELSDGQRYRYAVARCIAGRARTVVADEWCAKLDRVTARVVSRNARKIADTRAVGFLVATTHEDVIADLAPDTIVRCRGGGVVEVASRRPFRRGGSAGPAGRDAGRAISFLGELELTEGSPKDWPYFARWHYRGHALGFARRVVLLWHGGEPIGICVVGPSALASSARRAAFGLAGLPNRARARLINANFASVTRLVLDPRYRGAGIAGKFLRRVAETTDRPWIELASEMANLVPFAESAGFKRLGRGRDKVRSASGGTGPLPRPGKGCWYGRNKNRARSWGPFFRRVRFSRPAYCVFDNRLNCGPLVRPDAVAVAGNGH